MERDRPALQALRGRPWDDAPQAPRVPSLGGLEEGLLPEPGETGSRAGPPHGASLRRALQSGALRGHQSPSGQASLERQLGKTLLRMGGRHTGGARR
eukprot:6521009-Pyramimonas_sp.AAC.1